MKNILVGDFCIEGLSAIPDTNEILRRMGLELDGILEVTAAEKLTGKSKRITIANAFHEKSAEEIAAGRKRIQELYASRGEALDLDKLDLDTDEEQSGNGGNVIEINAIPQPDTTDGDAEARSLIERSRRLLDTMHAEDREEAIDLHERIGVAIESKDTQALDDAIQGMKELLFFVHGLGRRDQPGPAIVR